jgi:hypothetical protein
LSSSTRICAERHTPNMRDKATLRATFIVLFPCSAK